MSSFFLESILEGGTGRGKFLWEERKVGRVGQEAFSSWHTEHCLSCLKSFYDVFGITYRNAVPTSHSFTSCMSRSTFWRLTASGLYFSCGPLSCTLWKLFTYTSDFPTWLWVGRGRKSFVCPSLYPQPLIQNLERGSQTLNVSWTILW